MKFSRSVSRAATLLLLLGLTSCKGGCGLVDEFADEDGDGWFTKPNNLMTVLTLSTFAVSGGNQGRFRIVVDGVRFPNASTIPVDDNNVDNWITTGVPTNRTLNLPVAKRMQGKNAYVGGSATGSSTFTSVVSVEELLGSGPVSLGTLTLTYNNSAPTGTGSLSFMRGADTVTLTFTTASTRFADPNPANAAGDSDGDGITEAEEFSMVSSFAGIGDPQPGGLDLYLVVGFSEAVYDIDPYTVEVLKTRFFSRAINLHVDNGRLNGRPGIGGLMTLGGVPVLPGTNLSLAQATSMRNSNLPAAARRKTHFILLAAGIGSGFGITSGTPGNISAMDAQLEPLSPNIFNYQAGVLMHELGHQLGLCHPTCHTGAPATTAMPGCSPGTTCAAIPMGERNPGATSMGTPAETPGLIGLPVAIAQALGRPLDYTPTQWTLLTLGGGLAP